MQYGTLALIAIASTAIALPQINPIDPPQNGDKFGLEASGPSITKLSDQVTASRGRIFVGGEQGPVCEGGQQSDFATFVWNSTGAVFLYGIDGDDNPPQQLWVNASDMGDGISGYYTVGKSKPGNAGTEGFEINATGALTFNGVSPKACPVEAGKWSIWFSSSSRPGDQENCEDIALTAYRAPPRLGCIYSDPFEI